MSALRDLEILDTAPESDYDDLALLAASVCRSPVAAVNFVDDERHFTKAIAGMPAAEGGSVPNHLSFCAATLASPEGRLVIENTREDDRWSGHPLVTGGPHVGFYAGVSLMLGDERVGVLCAFGRTPRQITDAESTALRAVARQAERHLEVRRRNAELRDLVMTDPLTRLGNRVLLFNRLEAALRERTRSGGDVGVLFADVDDFKAINDRHGHQAGDRILCDIADRLRRHVREVDTVARVAGDEFVIVCPQVTARTLSRIVASVAESENPLLPDGSRGARLSVGSVMASDGEDAASVLRRADFEMYAAKQHHKQSRPLA